MTSPERPELDGQFYTCPRCNRPRRTTANEAPYQCVPCDIADRESRRGGTQ